MSIPVSTTRRPLLLQSGEGVGDDGIYVPALPGTVLWGRLLGRADAPVAHVRPGGRVVIDTVSHEEIMDDQSQDPVAFFREHGGLEADEVVVDTAAIAALVKRTGEDSSHVVIGPIAVEGARPGDLLAAAIEALDLRAPYEVVSTRHGRGILQGKPAVDGTYSAFCDVVEHDGAMVGRVALHADGTDPGHATFPLAPPSGVSASPPTHPASRTPPRPGCTGANSTSPSSQSAASCSSRSRSTMLCCTSGHPHFAQGDGEVAVTALEAPLRAALRVDVVPAAEAATLTGEFGPFTVAQDMLVPLGLSENLELALRRCVRNAVGLLTSLADVDPHRAYLYLSAVADFAVSQAVDIVKGVHGALGVSAFSEFRPGPFSERIFAAVAQSLEVV